MTTQIYIPSTASTIKHDPLIRLGLQGDPGTGKTTAAATFPNPIFLDFDNQLTSLAERKDILRVPFYDKNFVKDVLKVNPVNGINDSRNGLIKWLANELHKFTPEQTIVLDSWTAMQDGFDNIKEQEPVYDKKGELNPYDFWACKVDFSQAVMGFLSAANCNVVVIYHESKERDPKTGMLLDKIQPLMQGKFTAKIKKDFPYFFRSKVIIIDGKPQYVWQTRSSQDFDAKNANSKMPEFIPANYSSFIEYQK